MLSHSGWWVGGVCGVGGWGEEGEGREGCVCGEGRGCTQVQGRGWLAPV